MKKTIPALAFTTAISVLPLWANADVANVNSKAMDGQKPSKTFYQPDNAEMEYLVLDNTAIIMGDIAVGSPDEIGAFGIKTLDVKDFDEVFSASDDGLTAKAAWAGATTWPNSVVPYVIDPSSQADAAVIQAGMDLISSQTGVKFVKRNNQQHFIRIFKGQGCWSFIGRKGGQQNLSIGPGCAWKKTVAHELIHALGFLHEQSRADRDNYVRINYDNIQDGRAGQFNKKGPVTTSVGTYDYRSVMHYGHKAFSKNGLPTIVSLNPNIPNTELGKSNGLTNKDVAAIRNKYGAGVSTPLTAFGNCDFSGWSAKIPEGHHNLNFLQTKGFVNDQMSSFKVSPGWGIRLYVDAGWTGGNTNIMTGNKACMGSFNDRVSSLRVVPAGNTALADKTFFIKNDNSELYMDAMETGYEKTSSEKTAALTQSDFSGGSHQQFTFVHHGNGVYSIVSKYTQKVLSVEANSKASNAAVALDSYSTKSMLAEGQKFIAHKVGDKYQFIALHSNKVLVPKRLKNGETILKQVENREQASSYWSLQQF